MSQKDQVQFVVFADFPWFQGHMGNFNCGIDSEISSLIIAVFMLKFKFSGDVGNLPESINVYDRLNEMFLDKNSTISAAGLGQGGVIVLSYHKNENRLKNLVKVRTASTLDTLTMEIYNGK